MTNFKVLFDYNAFTYQKYGGVSNSFCQLISHFPSFVNYEIAIKESNNFHLMDSNLLENIKAARLDLDNFVTHNNFKGKYNLYHLLSEYLPLFPSIDRVNKHYSIDRIKSGDFDILHPTGFSTYFLKHLNGKPFVYTIHDMTTQLFSSSSGMKRQSNYVSIISKRANHIVAVSQNTKNDIIGILGIPESKITVIHHGAPSRNEKADFSYDQYFLYVGARHSYKYFIPFLEGFKLFCKKNNSVKLVCTGEPFNEEELFVIEKLQLQNNIIHTFVSKEQLDNLYSKSIAFVYPSLYEGFGMPILEAYSNGCPVVLNNKSCFPEVAGDVAIYFDSNNGAEDISNALNKIYNFSNTKRMLLISDGYERMNLFSWEESSKKLAQVYYNVLNK